MTWQTHDGTEVDDSAVAKQDGSGKMLGFVEGRWVEVTRTGQRSSKSLRETRETKSKPGVELARASALRMTRPTWTWDRRIPSNGVSLLAGLEGLGKTLIMLDVAARLTRGQLPGNRRGEPADAVYVGLEDDWSSIVLPRLVAAGADLERVHFVSLTKGGVFSVGADLPALREALSTLDALALVVVDPLDAHLGDDVDSHRKSEVQRAVTTLAELARDHECAVVGIGHLNKNELSRDVLMRIIGSKGFTTSARSVLAVGDHPDNDGEQLLVVRKSNYDDYRSVPALRYRVEACEVPHDDGGTVETIRVAWLGEQDDIDANAILGTPNSEERTERDDAAEWLTDLLVGGEPCAYKEVERLAAEAGIARATLHRARKLAGVIVERDEGSQGRPSTWRIPDGLSSQSLTAPGETKDVPLLTRENAPPDRVSSHVSEREGQETKPRGSDDPSPLRDWSFAAELEPCIVCGEPCKARDPEGRVRHPACPIEGVTP